MVTEAGGMVTSMGGGPFHSDDREILASNGTLHADLLDVIVTHDAPSVGNAQLGA